MITNQNLKDAAKSIGLKWRAEIEHSEPGLYLEDGAAVLQIWRPHLVSSQFTADIFPALSHILVGDSGLDVFARAVGNGKSANVRVFLSQFNHPNPKRRKEMAMMEAGVLALAAIGAAL